jgi:hypothetical protein
MLSQKLTTDQVLEVFTDEIASRGGKVTDTFNDGRRLFCRSVLPIEGTVRPGDRLHGGIALKATDEQICVYPYTFRLVCRNGAIRSKSVGSLSIEGLEHLATYFIMQSIRDGIDACSAPEIFHDTMNKIRTVANHELEMALDLMTFFSTHSGALGAGVFAQILERFFDEKDKTQFALANAITSTARDTKDPQARWNLEELGGGLLIALLPRIPQGSAHATVRDDDLIPVA